MALEPDWWDALAADAAVRDLGVELRPIEDWHVPGADEFERSDGTINIPALTERHVDICAGTILVGSGPVVPRRLMAFDDPVHWYLNPDKPDVLWCALDSSYPAWLWIPVEPTPAAFAEVLSASHPTPKLRLTELNRTAHGFIGYTTDVKIPNVYSGEFVHFNGHDLDRYMTMVHYTEVDSWGSYQLDDPMKDHVEPVSPLVMTAFKRNNMTGAQMIGRIPSMTWRTLHSRSYVSFEVHQRDLLCAAVRYRSSPESHQRVVARLNDEFGMDFPVDMPLDAIGTLTGFEFGRERVLGHYLTEPETPGHLAAGLRVFAALWSGDLRETLRLRAFAGHEAPQVRASLCRLANWYGYRFLLEDLAFASTDPDAVSQLEYLQLTLGSDEGDNYNAFDDYFSGVPVMVDRNGEAVATVNPPGRDDDEDYEEDEEEDAS
jgi:hypothetical protein